MELIYCMYYSMFEANRIKSNWQQIIINSLQINSYAGMIYILEGYWIALRVKILLQDSLYIAMAFWFIPK